MPLIECTECGKRGRVQDPVCWNCRHPRDVVAPVRAVPSIVHRAPAQGSAPAKPAAGAAWRNARPAMLFLGGLWFLALWLVFRLASPEAARAQFWAWAGAIPAMLVGYFAFGWRGKRALLAAAVFGAAGSAALIKPTLYEAGEIFGRTALAWTLFIVPGLALLLAGLGVGRKKVPASPEPAEPGDPAAPVVYPEAHGLQDDEQRIRERMKEIEAQRLRIEGARALLRSEAGAEALAPVREKLDYAEGVLQEQRVRHEARLWSIALVRWQRRLEPLAEPLHDPTADDATRRLKDLGAVVEDGTKLLQGWEAAPEPAATHEGQRCIAHLRDLLARCAGVRQAIVVQQALLAIRTVAPSDGAERTAALSTEPLEGLRTSLEGDGSLSHALASFEAEAERLRADHESAQDVDRFLRELER
jgi:hypothetical protein